MTGNSQSIAWVCVRFWYCLSGSGFRGYVFIYLYVCLWWPIAANQKKQKNKTKTKTKKKTKKAKSKKNKIKLKKFKKYSEKNPTKLS